MKWIDATSRVLAGKLSDLLQAPQHSCAHATPALFPDEPGLYIITDGSQAIRAGKTISLQQRIYRNHLMGTQPGNLRAQLVGAGECPNLDAAKVWIRENCSVRFLVIEDEKERSQLEHFMLSVIQPRFCDKNKVN